MRALVLYSAAGNMIELARGLASGLEAAGYQVQLLDASLGASNTNIPMAAYDLVCVGSPTLGLFGGGIAGDIDAALKKAVRLQGKPAAAFVRARAIGSGGSLRALMAALETQGAWVQDFAAVGSALEAERLGSRLQKVQKL